MPFLAYRNGTDYQSHVFPFQHTICRSVFFLIRFWKLLGVKDRHLLSKTYWCTCANRMRSVAFGTNVEYFRHSPTTIAIKTMSELNWKKHSADLLQMYEKLGLVGSSQFSLEGWNRSNFAMWAHRASSGRVLYHCIFTCPRHGIHDPCGRLENSSAIEIDNTIWYKTQRRAQQAAGAKAIDFLNHQNGNLKRGICIGALNMLPSGPVFPSMPYVLSKHLEAKRVAIGGRNQYWASAA
mmetsp:Transcript_21208/g.38458  ORF Transcript_21208/g.38458 Transcript_21208/m.38458 type:complete len:237 (+) Transcript_21208:45-755(+)